MSEPVVNPQPAPVRRVWPARLLVAAGVVSPLPVLRWHEDPGDRAQVQRVVADGPDRPDLLRWQPDASGQE